jgi:pyrroline-5-carboxylate reductase
LGILGAGRLGSALAERWRGVAGASVVVWSRRFESRRDEVSGVASTHRFDEAPLAAVMSCEIVFAALPSHALGDLAARHRAVADFAGTLLITGIDLHLDEVRRFTSRAQVVRVIPSLLAMPNSISSLVLERDCAGPRWQRAKEILETLGSIHCIADERAFETIMYLTSPYPVVLRRALSDALIKTLAVDGGDPAFHRVAERVLWGALASVAAAGDRFEAAHAAVVTPGGVTAAGLAEVPAVAAILHDCLLTMIRHGSAR